MAAPWSDEDSHQLRELHTQGKSLHAIAKHMQRSKETVSRHAERLGLSFDRAPTIKATAAVVADAKKLRADLALRLWQEAHHTLDQMHKPHLVWSFGGQYNEYSEHTLDEPDAGGRQKIAATVNTLTTAALKIEAATAETRDHSAVAQWLQAMTGGEQAA